MAAVVVDSFPVVGGNQSVLSTFWPFSWERVGLTFQKEISLMIIWRKCIDLKSWSRWRIICVCGWFEIALKFRFKLVNSSPTIKILTLISRIIKFLKLNWRCVEKHVRTDCKYHCWRARDVLIVVNWMWDWYKASSIIRPRPPHSAGAVSWCCRSSGSQRAGQWRRRWLMTPRSLSHSHLQENCVTVSDR